MIRNCRLTGTLIDSDKFISITYINGYNRHTTNGCNIEHIRCWENGSFVQYDYSIIGRGCEENDGIGITHYFDINRCHYILKCIGGLDKGILRNFKTNTCSKDELSSIMSKIYLYTFIGRLSQSTSDDVGYGQITILEVKLQFLLSIIKLKYAMRGVVKCIMNWWKR
jgi:hypothetical protein